MTRETAEEWAGKFRALREYDDVQVVQVMVRADEVEDVEENMRHAFWVYIWDFFNLVSHVLQTEAEALKFWGSSGE